MFSLEDLSAVRIAIELCNNSELKKELLCVHEFKCSLIETFKEQWKRIVKDKAETILKKLGLIEQLKEKTSGNVILIGIRMLKWVVYHERTLGLSREFSIKFLNSSFFTSQGTINNKKAAEELMKGECLSNTQKYKLTCLYCLTEHIPDLYREMSQEDKKQLHDDIRPERFKQPEIVKFWTFYLMGQIDELRGEKTLDEYMLETTVESGSKSAVEYCLEKTSLSRKKNAVIDAALQTVKTKVRQRISDDSVIFERNRYMEESWIPSDYFVDILYFLLAKMREDHKIEFLKKDIEGANYEMTVNENLRYSRVLGYLLHWPYQNYFMDTAQFMWDFLPERSYAILLFKICDKINPTGRTIKTGEENAYDYRKLFREFWRQSPDRYKRYVFCDKEIIHGNGDKQILNEGKTLFFLLFRIRNLTYEDWGIIELILDSATDQMKENIMCSKEGKDICIGLMKEEKWEIMEEFVSKCLPSKLKAGEFKRELIYTKEAQYVCCYFIKRDNWDAAESFIKFSALCEEEIMRLKRGMIYAENGRSVCINIVDYLPKIKTVDRFIRWCLPCEEVQAFRKDLLNNQRICELVIQLIVEDQLNLVNELFNWGLSSEEEIRKAKKQVAYTEGCSVCERLISDNTMEIAFCGPSYYYFTVSPVTGYRGRKWEHVEKLLTWCFSSEKEMNNFKKDCLLRVSGKAIHFNLIKSNQWVEAEIFFAWLGLSPEEVKELKRETLFNHEEAHNMLRFLMHGRIDEGSEQQVASMELLLRWCLTDKETVIEFRDHFMQWYDRRNINGRDGAALEKFDSAIEQRLSDLEAERRDETKVETK